MPFSVVLSLALDFIFSCFKASNKIKASHLCLCMFDGMSVLICVAVYMWDGVAFFTADGGVGNIKTCDILIERACN